MFPIHWTAVMYKGPSFAISLAASLHPDELLLKLIPEMVELHECAHAAASTIEEDALDRRLNDLGEAADNLSRRAHEIGQKMAR